MSEPGWEFWSPLFYRSKHGDVGVFQCVVEGSAMKVNVSFGASLRTRAGAMAVGLRQSEDQPEPESVWTYKLRWKRDSQAHSHGCG